MSRAPMTEAQRENRRRIWRESAKRRYVPHPLPVDPLADEKRAFRDARARLRAMKARFWAVGRATGVMAEFHRRRNKQWREANAERHKELQARWRAENAEHARTQSRHQKHKRRVWLRNAESSTSAEIEAHRARVGKRCAYCRARGRLTLDHIVPVSRGGAHVVRNIQFLCNPCNATKGARAAEDFARTKGLLL